MLRLLFPILPSRMLRRRQAHRKNMEMPSLSREGVATLQEQQKVTCGHPKPDSPTVYSMRRQVDFLLIRMLHESVCIPLWVVITSPTNLDHFFEESDRLEVRQLMSKGEDANSEVAELLERYARREKKQKHAFHACNSCFEKHAKTTPTRLMFSQKGAVEYSLHEFKGSKSFQERVLRSSQPLGHSGNAQIEKEQAEHGVTSDRTSRLLCRTASSPDRSAADSSFTKLLSGVARARSSPGLAQTSPACSDSLGDIGHSVHEVSAAESGEERALVHARSQLCLPRQIQRRSCAQVGGRVLP